MFSFLKKSKEPETFKLVATQTGTAIPIEEVPDPVFSGKVLGDGIAIIPTDNKVVSPVDGTITLVADTLHAYGIRCDNGIEILVHIGLDTVSLKGEGFTPHVEAGQKVKAGDLLTEVDLEFIKSKGLNTHTPCLISNMDEVKDVKCTTGTVTAGESEVICYAK